MKKFTLWSKKSKIEEKENVEDLFELEQFPIIEIPEEAKKSTVKKLK